MPASRDPSARAEGGPPKASQEGTCGGGGQAVCRLLGFYGAAASVGGALAGVVGGSSTNAVGSLSPQRPSTWIGLIQTGKPERCVRNIRLAEVLLHPGGYSPLRAIWDCRAKAAPEGAAQSKENRQGRASAGLAAEPKEAKSEQRGAKKRKRGRFGRLGCLGIRGGGGGDECVGEIERP
jgi:hypothetical protein